MLHSYVRLPPQLHTPPLRVESPAVVFLRMYANCTLVAKRVDLVRQRAAGLPSEVQCRKSRACAANLKSAVVTDVRAVRMHKPVSQYGAVKKNIQKNHGLPLRNRLAAHVEKRRMVAVVSAQSSGNTRGSHTSTEQLVATNPRRRRVPHRCRYMTKKAQSCQGAECEARLVSSVCTPRHFRCLRGCRK